MDSHSPHLQQLRDWGGATVIERTGGGVAKLGLHHTGKLTRDVDIILAGLKGIFSQSVKHNGELSVSLAPQKVHLRGP